MIEERHIKEKDFSWPLVSAIGKIHIIQRWKHGMLGKDETDEISFTIDDILEETIADLRTIKKTLYGVDVN